MNLPLSSRHKPSQLLGLTLIALMLFVVGMQCCHTLLATQTTAMACHHQVQTQGADSELPDKHCRCDMNPSQLSWNHDSDSGRMEQPEQHLLYVQAAFQARQGLLHDIPGLLLSTSHPPPLSGPPSFLSSTILRI